MHGILIDMMKACSFPLVIGLAGISSTAQAQGAPLPTPTQEEISIWPAQAPTGDGKFQNVKVPITVYRPGSPNGTAVVICPGGAYAWLMAEPEGHGIAKWLNQHGIVGIVLGYRMPRGNPYIPLLDAQRTIRIVRSKAGEWGCDPNRIGIMGFSAGGHLASTAGTHFDAGDAKSSDAVDRASCRPDFMILIYPVISMGEKGHADSRLRLLGQNPSDETLKLFSNEFQVTAQTPPAFMAHAKDDTLVPPANSKMFYDALKTNKVPTEYVELASGGHGLSGYHGHSWDEWQEKSLKWLEAMGFLKEKALQLPQ